MYVIGETQVKPIVHLDIFFLSPVGIEHVWEVNTILRSYCRVFEESYFLLLIISMTTPTHRKLIGISRKQEFYNRVFEDNSETTASGYLWLGDPSEWLCWETNSFGATGTILNSTCLLVMWQSGDIAGDHCSQQNGDWSVVYSSEIIFVSTNNVIQLWIIFKLKIYFCY